MPENPPPAYRWTVSLSDGQRFSVEAAYPVIDDGHMLLKDSAHKVVFAAAPGSGCSFTRAGLATSAPDTPDGRLAGKPDGCPHGFPRTVRCHQCSPVTAPGVQAEADAAFIRRGAITLPDARQAVVGADGGFAGGDRL
jgi:hypothetical protein